MSVAAENPISTSPARADGPVWLLAVAITGQLLGMVMAGALLTWAAAAGFIGAVYGAGAPVQSAETAAAQAGTATIIAWVIIVGWFMVSSAVLWYCYKRRFVGRTLLSATLPIVGPVGALIIYTMILFPGGGADVTSTPQKIEPAKPKNEQPALDAKDSKAESPAIMPEDIRKSAPEQVVVDDKSEASAGPVGDVAPVDAKAEEPAEDVQPSAQPAAGVAK